MDQTPAVLFKRLVRERRGRKVARQKVVAAETCICAQASRVATRREAVVPLANACTAPTGTFESPKRARPKAASRSRIRDYFLSCRRDRAATNPPTQAPLSTSPGVHNHTSKQEPFPNHRRTPLISSPRLFIHPSIHPALISLARNRV